MRFLKGVIIALLVVANSVYAQLTEVKIDNSSIPGENIASIIISQSGQVIVTSVVGVEYEAVEKNGEPGDVSINSFTLAGQLTADLDVGASATVNWGTSNAVTCTASTNPVGSLNDWNSEVDLTGSLTVTFPQAGVYNLNLSCSGENGNVDSAVVTARVGRVSITSFIVSPNSADKGSENVQVELTWSSENATLGCAGSSNWPNSSQLSASGTSSFSVSSIQQDIDYTLTCFGEVDDNDEDSRTVSISATDPQASCNVTLDSRRVRDWADVFSSNWPGPIQRQLRVSIPDYGFYAVKFTTGEQQDLGLLGNIEASGTHGERFGALSEIPGCFDVADECKYRWGRSGGIVWDTQGTNEGCQLKPNTTYYWNMTFTDGVNPSSSSCIGSACETYLLTVNPQ